MCDGGSNPYKVIYRVASREICTKTFKSRMSMNHCCKKPKQAFVEYYFFFLFSDTWAPTKKSSKIFIVRFMSSHQALL